MKKNVKLKIGWWNSSLSPQTKQRVDADIDNTLMIINHLLIDLECNFVAISEISENDAEVIENFVKDSPFCLERCFDKVGRGSFKQIYLYNRELISIEKTVVEQYRIGTSNYRVAHGLVLNIHSVPFPIIVFASHWRSKIHFEEEHRPLISGALRNVVENLLDETNDESHIILMGDYNAEPFQNSLSHHLLCLRDPNLITQKNRFLYNPFWAKLGVSSCGRICGSYYYKRGEFNKWYLYDQIIFSPRFLDNNNWKGKPEPIIVDSAPIVELVLDKDSHFDHLPVISHLEYTGEQI